MNWERALQEAWRDVLDPTLRQEMHVVTPQPPNLEPGIGGHVIMIQEPHETWVTSLVSIFDSFISARENNMMRMAITTDEQIRLEQIAYQCGYALVAGQIDPNVPCQGWIDGHHLPAGQRWPGRSGHEITLRVYRQVVQMPAQSGADGHVHFAATPSRPQCNWQHSENLAVASVVILSGTRQFLTSASSICLLSAG